MSTAQPRFPEHSPTVAGRWLASDLRKLRRAAHIKQTVVAKELGCTPGKVVHFESGRSPIKRADLLAMLPLYGVPEERRTWYLDLCEKARQKGWWDGADGVPTWFGLYVGLEWGAEQIVSYDLGTIPGLLQTREYAEAVMESGFPDEPETAAGLVDQRMQRQRALDRSQDPLTLHAFIDEAALRREVVSRKVMRVQLDHLNRMAEHPHVTVQVVPYSAGAHSGHIGNFHILDFPNPEDPGVVFLENRCGGLYLEENDELDEYRRVVSELASLALDVETTKDFFGRLARGR